ncbi:MAG: helix-turn-helix transcriptional regulator [Oscillospiraceae bacterium]|nr:helix-turn-helix transcriptional regulator [Oscillospiraceae bacterium]
MEHSDRILKILSERGITTYKLAKETGVTNSMFTEWRKKPSSKIYSGNLVRIADYLGCSVDYLLGRTEDPEVHQLPED